MPQKKILIIAGEASGDLHAANLVKQILNTDPSIYFYGMGGNKMAAAGVEILQDYREVSLIGLTEVIIHFPRVYKVFKKMQRIVETTHPDLVIFVDYPSFNLRMVKIAKRAGLKTFYYISPQLWAWHQSRVKIVKDYVDELAVVFPFEVDFYKKFNIDAKFVGHPLTDTVKASMSKAEAKQLFNLKEPEINPHNSQIINPIIGLLPGSRRGEIKRLLPVMLASAKLLQARFPQAQFILPLAPSFSEKDLENYLTDNSLPIKVITGHTYDVMNVCDAIMVTSGTATLETTLMEKPMVIVYRVSNLTYWVGKMLIKIKFLGIANIIANRPIIKELLQHDATAPAIAAEIQKITEDQNYANEIIENLKQVKQQLQAEKKIDAATLVLQHLF